jgi:hypothetical protein
VEPFGCCEPAHGEPPDCHCEDDDIRRTVEVVQTEENAYYDGTCQRCEGNDRVAKSCRSKRAVPLHRSGRRPPRSRDDSEERDAEDGTVDGRGQSHSNDHEREKRDHRQPGRSAVPLFVLHRAKPARSERRSASLKEWGRVKEMVGSGEHFRVVEACVRAGVVGVAGVRAGRGPPRRGLALRPASGDADWSSGPDGQRGARVRLGLGCRTVVFTI